MYQFRMAVLIYCLRCALLVDRPRYGVPHRSAHALDVNPDKGYVQDNATLTDCLFW
jgi:hypothetical protein